MSAPAALRSSSLANAAGRSLRRDIEGLRAVAILLVLVFHAGVTLVPGGFVGVDIFFVISGFLITAHMLREVESKGRLNLPQFFARRARRLIPAASAALLFSLAVIVWVVPSTVRSVFALDAARASVYVANWGFAERAVDYLAQEVGESPIQHFWSLGVEEQFYFLWPVIIVGGMALVRRFSVPTRPALGVLLAAVVVPSFWWSVTSTAVDPSYAFFDTRTRLWELGVGALAAVASPWLARMPRAVAEAIAGVGATMLALSALAVTPQTAWPGSAAVLPVLGTAAIIVAGLSGATAVGAALSVRPAVWIGGLSYALYLWHWPMVVAAKELIGTFDPVVGLLVVSAAVLPAWLSARYLERPIRFHPRLVASARRSLVMGVGLSLAMCGIALAVAGGTRAPEAERVDASTEQRDVTAESLAAGDPVGALALGMDPLSSPVAAPQARFPRITPAPEGAMGDSITPEGCQIGKEDQTPEGCVLGDPQGDVDVWLVGDSKMSQWYGALDAVGKANGWAMTMHTKSSCPFSDAYPQDDGGAYPTCEEWNTSVTDLMMAERPDLVIVSQQVTSSYLSGDPATATPDATVDGLVSRWTRLEEAGVGVIALLDHPKPDDRTLEQCVADHPEAIDVCAFDRAEGASRSGAPAMARAADRVDGVRTVSLDDWICPGDLCPAVIGNVLVYRNYNHLTATYVSTLTPALEHELAGVVLD